MIVWVVAVVLMVVLIIFLHCVCQKPKDTQTQTGSSNRTGYGTRNGGISIRNLDEFNLPVPSTQPIIPRVTISSDSNRRSVLERTNLSTHFLNETQHNLIYSYNAIPTISRPTFDNSSLQRQTSLPSYDQVIKQPKTQETPPPMYDEIANCELRRIFRSHARTSHV